RLAGDVRDVHDEPVWTTGVVVGIVRALRVEDTASADGDRRVGGRVPARRLVEGGARRLHLGLGLGGSGFARAEAVPAAARQRESGDEREQMGLSDHQILSLHYVLATRSSSELFGGRSPSVLPAK